MFDLDQFIEKCRAAVREDPSHKAVRDVVASAVSDPAAVLAGLGEPKRAEVGKLYHAPDLTILNVVWGPHMTIRPHNHMMWAVIGIYTGREDNIFWRRIAEAPDGRIEAANYRTVKIPSNVDIPAYVKNDFGSFYKAMFDQAVKEQEMKAVFVEYAWDMGWCDPCAAEPLTNKELVELGARWIGSDDNLAFRSGGGADAFVTRLHVRYDAKSFPEDLTLMETPDRDNFQGRYVLHHPWRGEASCTAAAKYRETLPARFQQEAKNLTDLTGWPRQDVEARMRQAGEAVAPGK